MGSPEQDARLDALRQTLNLFPHAYATSDTAPDFVELIALAEWVQTGSIDAAVSVVGQRHALYRQHRTGDVDG